MADSIRRHDRSRCSEIRAFVAEIEFLDPDIAVAHVAAFALELEAAIDAGVLAAPKLEACDFTEICLPESRACGRLFHPC
jgi:hypothetical protein